jgi:hypothetical protein
MSKEFTASSSALADNRMTAQRLYTGAVGFLAAAEATHERHLREPAEPEHWPAISVNLCFAFELSLKSFIALRGGDRRALKKIGHNLIGGLDAARAAGYVPNHPAVSEIVTILSPLHVSHSLRYLEDKSVNLPDTRNMISIVRHHVQEVGKQMPITDL